MGAPSRGPAKKFVVGAASPVLTLLPLGERYEFHQILVEAVGADWTVDVRGSADAGVTDGSILSGGAAVVVTAGTTRWLFGQTALEDIRIDATAGGGTLNAWYVGYNR